MLEMVNQARTYLQARLGEKGQGMIEYALIIAFVVGVAVYLTGNDSIGQGVQQTFQSAANQLKGN